MKDAIREKAERIRDVIRYIRKFKDSLIIIYIDDKLLNEPVFMNHIKDICLIHESGLQVIIVPGASRRIDSILETAGIKWTIHNTCRITTPEAIPLIKMAAFDVSNQIMTALAGEKKPAVIGNWVRARGKGVIDGFDYGTIGEIDKLDVDSIRSVLDNGFIPIFPCIGWSLTGKPYNISSIELAQQIAIHLQASKLFFMIPDAELTKNTVNIPDRIGLSPEGTIPALNIDELDMMIEANSSQTLQTVSKNFPIEKMISLLNLSKQACLNNVSRVHLINGAVDGSLTCEIFSDLGSGTMIYKSDYGRIREMDRDDVASVLSVMMPFIEQGILLPRTKESLLQNYQNYIVYELDGAVRACASLIPYPDGQMEIAGVAVEKQFSHLGIGPMMIKYLIEKSKRLSCKSLFLLTTQTRDWFEKMGFELSEISTLPEERRKEWTESRASKVLRYKGNQ